MATAANDMLEPEREVIRDFLSETVVDAIQLTAIIPDGAVMTRYFGDDAEAAALYAERESRRGRNIYWTVNIARPENEKPAKSDIVGIRFAHVDYDPPKDGGAFDKAAGAARLEALDPPPNLIVDTGGGLAGYWRTEGGTADEIEAANQGIAAALGADHCWNVDRIMRLPGTVNWPDRRKLKRGRIPAMARVWRESDGGSYSVERLRAAFPAPERAERAAEPGDGQQQAPFELATADSLGLSALDPLRSVIDHPAGRDRSRDVLRCAGDMARAGYTREQVLGVLMNPANAVSAHIFDQSDPRRAALKVASLAFDQPPESKEGGEASAPEIAATPYLWRDPATIPPREWVMGRWLLRGTLTGVLAAGGTGKSTLMAGTALSLTTGRDLLGKPVWGGPKKVWLWNLEDDGDELARAVQAAADAFGITPDDVGTRLFVDSAMDGKGLCTAIEDDRGFRLLEPVYEALTAELIRRQIDVLIVDPFVSSHEVEENANTLIDKIAKRWGRVAKAARCSIVLVHHVSKAGASVVTAHSSRGAVALPNACRQVLVLNRMDPETAERFGIEEEERWRYFNAEDDKRNRAPAEKLDWFRLESVDLGNGNSEHPDGDSVGVAMPWTPADPFDNVSGSHLLRVQQAIDAGEWRENIQSPAWAGRAVATVMGWDADAKADRARIKAMLRTWRKEGALTTEIRKDAKRNERTFIVVGRWQSDTSAPPVQGEAGQGGAVGRQSCPTTTPHFSGVVGRGAASEESEVRRGKGQILAPGETGDEPVPGF